MITPDVRPPRPLADLITASGLTRDTVKALIRAGQLPGYKAGRKYVIPAEAFDRWQRGEWEPRPVPITPTADPEPDAAPMPLIRTRKAS